MRADSAEAESQSQQQSAEAGWSLLRCAASRVIDQHLPHDSWRDGEEVDLVGERSLGAIGEFQPGLVDQRRRLERVVRTLAGEVPQGNPVQLLIQRRR